MSREIRLRLLMATILPAAVALVGACTPLPPAATEPVDQVAPRPALADPDALRARAAVYWPQIVAYAVALQQALDLPTPPRAELWFLAVDEIVRVDLSVGPGTPGPR